MAETENELLNKGSDNELFNETTSDKPAQTPEAAEVVDEPSQPDAGRQRDAQGKFVAKPKEEQEADSGQVAQLDPLDTKDGKQAMVPSFRLREEREAKNAAEDRLQEALNRIALLERTTAQQPQQQFQQPRQEPQPQKRRPDPLLDPEGAEAFDNEVRTQERRELNFNLSCRFARLEHKDVFDEAFKAVSTAINQGDAALQAQIKNSSDPGNDIVRWYQEKKVFSEVGPDPLAYREKLRDDLLKDPEFLAKAIETARQQASGQNGTRPNTTTKLPPSLNSVAGGNTKQSAADDNSEAAVFRQAFG